MSVLSNISYKKPNYKNRKKNVRNLARRPAIAKKLPLLHGPLLFLLHSQEIAINWSFWLLTLLVLSKHNYLIDKNKQK